MGIDAVKNTSKAYELINQKTWKTPEQAKKMVSSLTKEDLNALRQNMSKTGIVDKINYLDNPEKAKLALKTLNLNIMNTFEKISLESMKNINPNILTSAREVIRSNPKANTALLNRATRNKISLNTIKKTEPARYALALTQALMISCCGQNENLQKFYNISSNVDGKYGLNTLTALKNVLETNSVYKFNGVINGGILSALTNKTKSTNVTKEIKKEVKKTPEVKKSSVKTPEATTQTPDVKKEDTKTPEAITTPKENPFKDYSFIGPDGKATIPTDNKDGTVSLNIAGTDVLIATTKEGTPTLKIGEETFNMYPNKTTKEIKIAYDAVTIVQKILSYKAVDVSLDGATKTAYTGSFDLSKKEQIDVHLSAKDQAEIIVVLSNTGDIQTKEVKINNIDYTISFDKAKKELALTKKAVVAQTEGTE